MGQASAARANPARVNDPWSYRAQGSLAVGTTHWSTKRLTEPANTMRELLRVCSADTRLIALPSANGAASPFPVALLVYAVGLARRSVNASGLPVRTWPGPAGVRRAHAMHAYHQHASPAVGLDARARAPPGRRALGCVCALFFLHPVPWYTTAWPNGSGKMTDESSTSLVSIWAWSLDVGTALKWSITLDVRWSISMPL